MNPLIRVLEVPVVVDDGYDGELTLTHRAFELHVSPIGGTVAAAVRGLVVMRTTATLGVLRRDGVFRPWPGTERAIEFTADELQAVLKQGVTLAELLDLHDTKAADAGTAREARPGT